MTTLLHHYRPVPPPPPPDEDYWTALLTQTDEEELDYAHIFDDEEANWLDVNAFQRESNNGVFGKAEDWHVASDVFEHDRSVVLPVVGFNKGGLLVDWGSLRGFVPASQLASDITADPATTSRNLHRYIGEDLELRVIELNPEQNRLILSQRAAQVSPGTRASTLQNLKVGDSCTGIVTNICDFGVFIDLGGIEGLIHISELSWGRVEHPAEVVQRNEKIKVYVMDILPDEGRIALSIKRLQPDPWLTVEEHYTVGQHVEAVITTVVNFGAFAALQEGLEGLIHTSELAEGHFLHPRNVVREGERVRVRILNIDSQARRIGLSLRNQP